MSNDDTGFLPYDPDDLDRSMADKDLLDLFEEVERDVVGWLPDQQAKIGGRVVEISEATSSFQKTPMNPEGKYPLVIIETPSGKLVGIHCFHTVLRNEITRKIANGNLARDWQIAVLYKGEGEAAEGRNAPNMYRVVTRPPRQ